MHRKMRLPKMRLPSATSALLKAGWRSYRMLSSALGDQELERSLFHVRTVHGTMLAFEGFGLEHSTNRERASKSSDAFQAMADAGSLGDIEVIVLENASFALRRNGFFACAEPGRTAVLFDRRDIGPWETFFCYEDNKPIEVHGLRFETIPTALSSDFVVYYQQMFDEDLPKPIADDADLHWFEENSTQFYAIHSGVLETSVILARSDNKILSTRYRAHSSLFDQSGFLNNYGFLYLRKGEYTNLSIDPTNDSIRCNFSEITAKHFLQGSYLLPFDGNSFNYYHFILDGLIHLLIMKERGLSIPFIFFTDGRMLPWQAEYFELFGHESMLTINGEEKDLIAVEQIYYFKTTGLPVLSKKIVREFAHKIKQSAGLELSHGRFRRLYVKRKPGVRSVKNQDELERQLRQWGFEAIDLEGLSVATQVRLFAEADFIIGPHGAGLVNIIFCQPGAALIELIPGSGEVRNCFWLLATKVDVKYSFVRCDAAYNYGGELNADLSMVETALRTAGAI